GVVIHPSFCSSSIAVSSAAMFRSVNGICFSRRNSFSLLQNSQPGCVYTVTDFAILNSCMSYWQCCRLALTDVANDALKSLLDCCRGRNSARIDPSRRLGQWWLWFRQPEDVSVLVEQRRCWIPSSSIGFRQCV